MSMMLTLRRLSDEDLAELSKCPDEVLPLLYDIYGYDQAAVSADQKIMENAIQAVGKDNWIAYANAPALMEPLLTAKVASTVIEYLEQNSRPDVSKAEYLDLDKSWHILHTLISGSPDISDKPEASLLGGEEVGPFMNDHGSVRILRKDQVSDFATVIEDLDAKILLERFEPNEFKQLGVAFAQNEFDLDLVCIEVEDYFPKLQKFIKQTVKKKRALLMILD